MTAESGHIGWLPLGQIPALISGGQITPGTTVAALLYAITAPPPMPSVSRRHRPYEG